MGLGSAWLCVPLCLLSRTPPRAPFPTRVSGLVGEAAFEKSRGLRGEGARGHTCKEGSLFTFKPQYFDVSHSTFFLKRGSMLKQSFQLGVIPLQPIQEVVTHKLHQHKEETVLPETPLWVVESFAQLFLNFSFAEH